MHTDVEHQIGADIIPNMTRSPRVKYITYYEDSESLPGQRTAVWEIDKGIFFFFFINIFRALNLSVYLQQIIGTL